MGTFQSAIDNILLQVKGKFSDFKAWYLERENNIVLRLQFLYDLFTGLKATVTNHQTAIDDINAFLGGIPTPNATDLQGTTKIDNINEVMTAYYTANNVTPPAVGQAILFDDFLNAILAFGNVTPSVGAFLFTALSGEITIDKDGVTQVFNSDDDYMLVYDATGALTEAKLIPHTVSPNLGNVTVGEIELTLPNGFGNGLSTDFQTAFTAWQVPPIPQP